MPVLSFSLERGDAMNMYAPFSSDEQTEQMDFFLITTTF